MSRFAFRASWIEGALVAAALGLAVSHCAAIYTESINWDEFALFHRTEETVRTGILKGGGRPGLGPVLLMPLVRGCQDAIAVVQAARWGTAFATFAFLAGLFVVMCRMLEGLREHPRRDAAFGLALLVCVPAFLRWSIQVRTDQFSLAFGVWAGVALIASQRRLWFAAVAGALFGLGWLFNQKVAYIAALMFLLVAGLQFLSHEYVWRREIARVALCVVAACLVVALFQVWIDYAFLPPPSSARSKADDAEFYRHAVGYRAYFGILTTLDSHVIVVLLMLVAPLLSRDAAQRRQLALAWAVLLLGAVVVRVHATAYPYFWMTLGAFPAVAGAIAIGPVLRVLSNPRLRGLIAGALWLALLAAVVPAAASIAKDTQRIQRESLSFVASNFPPSARGFQPEGALFCRKDPDPYPVYQGVHISYRLADDASVKAFIQTFVQKPVSFIISSVRLRMFPAPILAFWAEHYVLYGTSMMVPGFLLHKDAIHERRVETIVAGAYRWYARPITARMEVDGTALRNGEAIALSTGVHRVRALDPLEVGLLTYALKTPPGPTLSFYPPSVVRELDFGR